MVNMVVKYKGRTIQTVAKDWPALRNEIAKELVIAEVDAIALVYSDKAGDIILLNSDAEL
jgi:hypothetical protein